MRRLSLQEARRLSILANQLAGPRPGSLLEVVERLTRVQVDPTSAVERAEGFLDALAAAGVAVPPERVIEGGYTFISGVAAAESLLTAADRPTAVFASNDEMAAGVYSVAHRRGLRIPDDLSVVGYDDSDLASQLWPALTTLRLPVRTLGRQAAERLLQDAEAPMPRDEVFLDLVARQSTAPPAA